MSHNTPNTNQSELDALKATAARIDQVETELVGKNKELETEIEARRKAEESVKAVEDKAEREKAEIKRKADEDLSRERKKSLRNLATVIFAGIGAVVGTLGGPAGIVVGAGAGGFVGRIIALKD